MSARRFLVVDDSPADRASVRFAFERSGLPVSLDFAESKSDALAHLRAGAPPHMMLVDIHMPGGSGLDLLAELKKDRRLREIPVYMLSGSQDPDEIRRAYGGQACGFLRKPDDLETLRRLVEMVGRLCVEALRYPQEAAKP